MLVFGASSPPVTMIDPSLSAEMPAGTGLGLGLGLELG